MPRQNRRAHVPPRGAAGSPSAERRDEWRGEEYVVRSVSGTDRVYRCPGCDQEIRAGVPHVVAWPADDLEAGHRRHWHTSCWAARDRRGPDASRSRSAPRY